MVVQFLVLMQRGSDREREGGRERLLDSCCRRCSISFWLVYFIIIHPIPVFGWSKFLMYFKLTTKCNNKNNKKRCTHSTHECANAYAKERKMANITSM